MALTSSDIVNQALEFIGSQAVVNGNDGSVEANAAAFVYTPTVNMVLRQTDPEFAKRTAALVAVSGGDTISPPWPAGYVYPSDCVRLRAVIPSSAVMTSTKLDPRPVRWTVAADNGVVTDKVIFASIVSAMAVYTSSNVIEAQWDFLFVRAVVKALAEPLAMAIAGRPDFAKTLFEQAGVIAQLSESRLG